MKPTCLVVVPTRGRFEYAAECVRSAAAHARAVAVVPLVVDDASPDWSDAWAAALRAAVPALETFRFDAPGGLLRSWNRGLRDARGTAADLCLLVNSDVYLPPGWDVHLVAALGRVSLAGPLTNAPGTEEAQYVAPRCPVYDPRRPAAVGQPELVQADLAERYGGGVERGTLNGFMLMAATDSWWACPHDADHVFPPAIPLDSKGRPNPDPLSCLGEYELQRRRHRAGLTSGVALGGYALHYRSASRGPAHRRGDWCERPAGGRPVPFPGG